MEYTEYICPETFWGDCYRSEFWNSSTETIFIKRTNIILLIQRIIKGRWLSHLSLLGKVVVSLEPTSEEESREKKTSGTVSRDNPIIAMFDEYSQLS